MPNHSLDCFLFFLAGITSFYHYIIFAFRPFDGHDGTQISIYSVDVCSFQISLSDCHISISTFRVRVRKIDWYNQKLQQLQLQSGFCKISYNFLNNSDFMIFIIGPIQSLPPWNKWNMSEKCTTWYLITGQLGFYTTRYDISEESALGLKHQVCVCAPSMHSLTSCSRCRNCTSWRRHRLSVFLKGTSADHGFDKPACASSSFC